MPAAGVLHLVVPGLLDRIGEWAQAWGPVPRFAGIEALLSRAGTEPGGRLGAGAVLCALAGIEARQGADLPVAPLRRLGLTATPGEGFLACADPVHLKADIQEAYLYDAGTFGISEGEAAELVALFNGHFAPDGLSLEATSPVMWHLRLDRPEHVLTRPLEEVRGGSISGSLPRGERALYWHGLMNEVQMLFHGAPVNRQREAAGRPVINGLWLHGVGELPPRVPGVWAGLWAGDPLAHGVARRMGLEPQALPENWGTLASAGVSGEHVVVLDGLSIAAGYDDLPAWEAELRVLDADWFGPLEQSLRRKDIDMVTLHDCAGRRFVACAGRRWWTRTRPLSAIAAGAA